MSRPPVSSPALVADIGGTNARFALVDPGARRPRDIQVMAVADYPTLELAIEAYLARCGGVTPPRQVCLAIACPVADDQVVMTNHGWAFSRERLCRGLGLERLEVINDYAAQAYALPGLTGDELFQVGGGAALAGQPLAILGPGTGLGVGGLVRYREGAVAVVSEGGHVDFAPTNELEIEILRYLWRDHDHVSVERVLSGMGLVNLHRAIGAIRGRSAPPLTPAQITAAALEEGDPLCLEVLHTFCALLGGVAGNTALTLGARGGVYITGGILPRMLTLFAESAFRQRFEAKGRFRDYLAAIPTYVVAADHPGLLGAAAFLRGITSPSVNDKSEEPL